MTGFVEGVTVVTILDRTDYAERLSNCLRSIRKQEFEQTRVDIIVAFLFRDEGDVAVIKAVADKYDARVVAMVNRFTQTNRSLARNLGARRAKRHAVMFVDVDTVLHPKALEVGYEVVSSGMGTLGRRAAYFSQRRLRHRTFSDVYRADTVEQFEKNAKRGEMDLGTLGNFMVETEVVHHLRGFDERFQGWGAEDSEFANRLARHGCHPLYCSFKGLKIFNIHQYHPPFSGRRDNRAFSRNNSMLLGNIDTRRATVINGFFWGGAPTDGDVWSSDDVWNPAKGNDLFGPFDPVAYKENLDLRSTLCEVGGKKYQALVPKKEKRFLMNEIFKEKQYELHGKYKNFDARCIVDVGANVGLYTIYAHLRYPDAFITSYEPIPPVADVLYENTKSMGDKCNVVRMGLTGPGRVDVKRVCISSQSGLTSTLRQSKRPTRNSVEVFLSSGITAVKNEKGKIVDILKIDTEGSELDILRAIGKEVLAKKVRFVLLEYHGDVKDVHREMVDCLGEAFSRVKVADGGRMNHFVNNSLMG